MIMETLLADHGNVGATVADTSLSLVTSLSAEVVVLRERLEIVERLCEAQGLFGPNDIDAFKADAGVAAIFKQKRLAFIARVFGAMRV